jgi:hypothetical protein
VTGTRKLWVGVLVGVAALVAGCGGDDDNDSAASSPTGATDSTEVSGTTITDGDGGDGDDGGGSGSTFTCAVTPEQASDILGASVDRQAEGCFFSPGGTTGIPTAGFLPQEFCDEDFAKVLGYSETYDGLDADAWVRIDGEATAQLLVCADAGFDVFVDTGTLSDDAADAAIAQAAALAEAQLEAG